jgi:hypothetical protein
MFCRFRQVGAVEVNALRETLGARPPPRPVAGVVQGTLHCHGPLDHPIFTGTAATTAPTPEARLPQGEVFRDTTEAIATAAGVTPAKGYFIYVFFMF